MERREGREQCQNVGKGDRGAGSGRPGNGLNANGREQMTAVHLPRPCLCPCPHPRLSVPHRSRRSFLSNLSLIPRPTPSLLPCFPLFSLRALRAFLPPSSHSIRPGLLGAAPMPLPRKTQLQDAPRWKGKGRDISGRDEGDGASDGIVIDLTLITDSQYQS